MSYRYRDNSCGVTRISLDRMKKHLHKVGEIVKIKAYRFSSTRSYVDNECTANREAVMVTGSNGTARFEGFCWGYFGTGPRGLEQLLRLCGVSESFARLVACETHRGQDQDHGIDWELINLPEGWRFNQINKKEAA